MYRQFRLRRGRRRPPVHFKETNALV